MIVHALQHKMAVKSVLVYGPCILKVVNCNLSSIVVLHALQQWIQGRGNGPIPSPSLPDWGVETYFIANKCNCSVWEWQNTNH